MAQNDYGALQYLPPKHERISHDDKSKKERYGPGMQKGLKQGIRPPQASESKSPSAVSRNRPQRTPKNQFNWASGGPRMQAIFLGSNPRSGGTGVFLPRTEGIGLQMNNKPVLLPSRVVQTLNLNVHEIGQQIKPQTDQSNNNVDENLDKNKIDDDINCSPEISLPEEWSYDI